MTTNLFFNKPQWGTVEHTDNYAIYYDSTAIDIDTVQDFSSAPDFIFNSGRKVPSAWGNSSIDKSIVKIRNSIFFVKRYNCLGLTYKIKNMYRKSKALKSWENGFRYREAGISTPRPIICLEKRRSKLLGDSYLVCEHLDDAHNLLEIWHDLDAVTRIRYIRLAGIEIGHMHHMGFLHGDLNWRNIIIQKESDHEKIYLVDLDGCYFSNHVNKKKACRDLKHFYRDLKRNKASQGDIDAFQQAWQKTYFNDKTRP
ncbi:MAG: hypothetical protein JW902_02920 [Syntrophaceae bacterium]|nr:hypothetical protein [Syntrophaceae bacterium]